MTYNAITITHGDARIGITSENSTVISTLQQPSPVVSVGGGVCIVLGIGPGGAVDYGTYLKNLPKCKSEEEASAPPFNLVSGDQFVWAEGTDVGIAGDLHIML